MEQGRGFGLVRCDGRHGQHEQPADHGAVIANGDFTEYWQHHMRRDYQRSHAAPYQEQPDIAA